MVLAKSCGDGGDGEVKRGRASGDKAVKWRRRDRSDDMFFQIGASMWAGIIPAIGGMGD